MFLYLLRRFFYALPTVVGVNVFVFILFFFINTPDDMARLHLGVKRVSQEQIERWKQEHFVHLPYFYNSGWEQISILSASQVDNISSTILPYTNGQLQHLKLSIAIPKNSKLMSNGSIKVHFNQFSKLNSNATLVSKLPNNTYETFITINKNSHYADLYFDAVWLENATIDIILHLDEPTIKYQVRLNYKRDMPFLSHFTETIFYIKSLKMIVFDYGLSEDGKRISDELMKRAYPSLSVTLPSFFIGITLNIFLAMLLAFHHTKLIDRFSLVVCSIAMSISVLFYVILGQFVFGVWLKIFPISGFSFDELPLRFIALPVLISVLSSLGGGIRFYRTLFLEEISKEYVLTAKAKGASEYRILFIHVLKNAMIPILTNVVTHLPFLFIGSLLLESFFSIPGLGAYMLEAIQKQDFSIVQSMVSLGSFLYILGLILTDVSYKLVDPRIKFR